MDRSRHSRGLPRLCTLRQRCRQSPQRSSRVPNRSMWMIMYSSVSSTLVTVCAFSPSCFLINVSTSTSILFLSMAVNNSPQRIRCIEVSSPGQPAVKLLEPNHFSSNYTFGTGTDFMHEDVPAAIDRGTESEAVEFKASLDPHTPAEWLEIVKDLVAFANSGGGVIVFGVADDGEFSNFDCSMLYDVDPAVITDKVNKYTGQQFHSFELVKLMSESRPLFVVVVSGVASPLVFTKPGTYDIGGGKQKTAFSSGTVYFRHGAKSDRGQ